MRVLQWLHSQSVHPGRVRVLSEILAELLPREVEALSVREVRRSNFVTVDDLGMPLLAHSFCLLILSSDPVVHETTIGPNTHRWIAN